MSEKLQRNNFSLFTLHISLPKFHVNQQDSRFRGFLGIIFGFPRHDEADGGGSDMITPVVPDGERVLHAHRELGDGTPVGNRVEIAVFEGEGVATLQGQHLMLDVLEKAKENILVRELEHNLFGQRIVVTVLSMTVGRQPRKEVTVGMDKETVSGSSHANIVTPK